MANSIQDLLLEPDDFKLCTGIFACIAHCYGPTVDLADLAETERVVFLVEHVSGIIGNGGFRYLFEGQFRGDPYFALTLEAFQVVGCHKATDAVRQTLAMFPNSRPPTDISERLRLYLRQIKSWPTDLDSQFFEASPDLFKYLAGYIRSHSGSFEHLEIPPADSDEADSGPEKATPQRNQELAELPHWARVAFAARCARKVLPLLVIQWPMVSSKHRRALELAIELAEASATAGRPAAGLRSAIRDAVVVAGAALAGKSEWAEGESGPEDAYCGSIAANVAKAAENAAEAALARADESLTAATSAWGYATSAATSADERRLARKLHRDLLNLYETARPEDWENGTGISWDTWPKARLDRSNWPWWVRLGLWGLPTRAGGLAFFWLSLVAAIGCLLYGFRDHRFFSGGLLFFAALWYFLAVRWVGRHGRWS